VLARACLSEDGLLGMVLCSLITRATAALIMACAVQFSPSNGVRGEAKAHRRMAKSRKAGNRRSKTSVHVDWAGTRSEVRPVESWLRTRQPASVLRDNGRFLVAAGSAWRLSQQGRQKNLDGRAFAGASVAMGEGHVLISGGRLRLRD